MNVWEVSSACERIWDGFCSLLHKGLASSPSVQFPSYQPVSFCSSNKLIIGKIPCLCRIQTFSMCKPNHMKLVVEASFFAEKFLRGIWSKLRFKLASWCLQDNPLMHWQKTPDSCWMPVTQAYTLVSVKNSSRRSNQQRWKILGLLFFDAFLSSRFCQPVHTCVAVSHSLSPKPIHAIWALQRPV